MFFCLDFVFKLKVNLACAESIKTKLYGGITSFALVTFRMY